MTVQDKPKTFDPDALRAKYREERDKRLRTDRDAQYHDATGEFSNFADDPFVEQRLERDAVAEEVDVVVVGGGFGGLISGAKLSKAGNATYRIIEQAADFGGTWYWNRYPGIRCDIESYVYMPMLEETGTVPSEKYVSGAEIFEHCRRIGKQFGLYDNAMFQTKVERIEWIDADKRWTVTTDRGDQIKARFVMIGQGPLMKIKLPGIKGFESFDGKIFHSSRWDYDYTGGDTHGGQTGLKGKKVGVIGTGATGIQIVPKLAEHADHVYVFQRTPSTIAERNNSPTDMDWFKNQKPGWQSERMDNFMAIITGQKFDGNLVGDGWTDIWERMKARMGAAMAAGETPNPPQVMQGIDFEKMEELRARVDEIVQDPKVAEAAKPWYNYACKRPLFSDVYLQALNQDNVTLVDTDGKGVAKIDGNNAYVGDTPYELDCIVLATGFDVGQAADKAGGYDVVGRDGVTLTEYWSDGVKTLHGSQVSGFPNFHIVGGTAQGPLFFNYTHVLEIQAEHAVDQISHYIDKGIEVAEITKEDEAAWYQEVLAKKPDRAAFYEACTPGFLNNEGNLDDGKATFTGSAYGGVQGVMAYREVTNKWREDLKSGKVGPRA